MNLIRTDFRVTITVLLGLLALYLILIIFPAAAGTQILGAVGDTVDGRFRITDVFSGSPADVSGLKVGDQITALDGIDIERWRFLNRHNVGAYLKMRADFQGRAVVLAAVRNGEPLELTLQPRPLRASELMTHFGIRLFMAVFLMALAGYVVASRTSGKEVFLFCLCFCFAAAWLASGQSYWPYFFSPLIRVTPIPLIYVIDIIESLSLQMTMATLLHIALVFPQQYSVLREHPRLPSAIYALSLAVPTAAALSVEGGLLEGITAIYETRLWLNTLLLVAVVLLMVIGYRSCVSPLQRERARWIVASMSMVAAVNVFLWNLPSLLIGQPLVPNYNWILVPSLLLPLSMTFSIVNHELFGIRGIVRGRIRLLEAQLAREHGAVLHRDQRIARLGSEIQLLSQELQQYERIDQRQNQESERPLLARLEKKFPEITSIRQERLLGVSPVWEVIFEQAVLAARGLAPVLIVGESGTGKTDLAWTIFRLGERKEKIYKEVSCAQFEHTDPAFALGRLFGIGSGHGLPNVPKEGKPGLLQECDGGTLFLDDLDRLPLNVQDLLLYPIEGKHFEPGMGSGAARSVSIKFLFATNRSPEELVTEGSLRSDVLARISRRVDLPPLRERPEDLQVLVDHFVRQVAAEMKHEISFISPKTKTLLCGYPYQDGNARELRAEIEQAVGRAMLEDDGVLRAGYLSERLRGEYPTPTGISGAAPAAFQEPPGNRTKAVLNRELAVLKKHDFQIKPAEEELGYSHKSRTLSHHLRGICLQALAEHDWDVAAAAQVLAGLDQPRIATKLQTKMERYLRNIDVNVARKTEKKLYRNLPALYQGALDRAIAHAARRY